jgi:nucleoid DNA-binding protein
MSVFYRKYQNKNPHSVSYGKWFARAVTIGKTFTVEDLAKHMSEHNTPYSKGAIKGVLTDMIDCIRELMLEGKAVKLDGLAIFSAGIKTKKKGAPTSEDFSTTKHIDSVYMRARATGEFTRTELTKAGSVTELPKNYTDYHEEDEDDPQNPSGVAVALRRAVEPPAAATMAAPLAVTTAVTMAAAVTAAATT